MSTLQEPTVSRGPEQVDPHTVSISGYVLDECYGPDSVETTEPGDPRKSGARIGRPGRAEMPNRLLPAQQEFRPPRVRA